MAPVSNKEFILFSAPHAIVKLQIHLLNLTTFKDSFSRSFQYFYKISDKIPIVKQWRWGLRSGRSQSSGQLWAERTSHLTHLTQPTSPPATHVNNTNLLRPPPPPTTQPSSHYRGLVFYLKDSYLYLLNNQLSWIIILILFLILNQKCVFWIKYVKIRMVDGCWYEVDNYQIRSGHYNYLHYQYRTLETIF